MIVFGICVASDERLRRWVLPGIERSCGPGVTVLQRRNQRSIYAAYNSILDEAAQIDDLTSLVLLHDDTEIRDERLGQKLDALFADGSVGLVGAIGARGVTSLAWWEADRRGRLSWDGVAPGEGGRVEDFGAETADVDSIDGLFMALSPWAVTSVRFDERRYRGFHGYDVDYSFEVRSQGRRVIVSDFDLHHHNEPTGHFDDRLGFLRNDIRWQAKWGFHPRSTQAPRLAALAITANASSVRRRARGLLGRTSTITP